MDRTPPEHIQVDLLNGRFDSQREYAVERIVYEGLRESLDNAAAYGWVPQFVTQHDNMFTIVWCRGTDSSRFAQLRKWEHRINNRND